jgi:chromosome segregation ATPase
MCSSRRSERRRKRSVEKRAEALARLPKMLADEQALRENLTALHDRAKRVSQHAEYDQQIRELTSRWKEISDRLVSELAALTNAFARIALNGAKECDEARKHLGHLHALRSDTEFVLSQLAELCVARVELNVVPVDREDLASQIDEMAKRFEKIERGIAQNQAMFASMCPDAAIQT